MSRRLRCMYSSDCLANRAAIGCSSTATLHIQLGLSRQHSSPGICFHGYAACTVLTFAPTEQLWDVFPRLHCMYSSDYLTKRAALGCFFHGYDTCTVRTVSPTEKLWDVFQQLRCVTSSDCFTNRTDLVCVSRATGKYISDCLTNTAARGCFFSTLLRVQFGLSHRHSSSEMFPLLRVRTPSTADQHLDVFPRLCCKYGSECLANRAALGVFPLLRCITVRTVSPTDELLYVFPRLCCSTARTVSPTEQLWDVFSTATLYYSSNCLTNRAALGCVSTALL